jgi:hypothetical protein
MRYFLACVLIFSSFACQIKPESGIDNLSLPEVPTTSDLPTAKADELVTNESSIGKPGKNKVEVRCFRKSEKTVVKIYFYSSKYKGDWQLQQSLEFEKLDELLCDPKFEDFNNDGLNDLTFVSDIAARGANEIRTLLIYDKKRDELVHIKNSDDYPNLAYNSRLDCIDAWLVYGGTMTVFLKLNGDVLEQFASVENFPPNRTVTVQDRDGRKKVILQDRITDDDLYIRYKNFKPLEF